jgi:hypothetical protein
MQISLDRYADCSVSRLSMANPRATKDHDRISSELSRKLREGRPQRRLDLLCRSIEGEAVILNDAAGVLHRLNPTASFIWECCDGTSSVDDIVARLANAYDVDLTTCEKDVSEIVIKLESLNLLTRKTTTSSEG